MLRGGHTCHCTKVKKLRRNEGVAATVGADNVEIAGNHFKTVFNRGAVASWVCAINQEDKEVIELMSYFLRFDELVEALKV